jgi:DNA polymerase-3 subunit delta
VFYVFHGEDQFSLAEELAGLRARLAGGDPAMGDLNTTDLEGGHLTLGELRHVCDAIPFLADRRLVIVRGLLARLAPGGRRRRKPRGKSGEDGEPTWKRDFCDQLAAYLPNLPPTTRLIFVEGETLRSGHPILQVTREEGKDRRAFVKHFALPKDWELPRWIEQRAKAKGGILSTEAVQLLAALVGADLRLLDQEIEKLLLYAGDRQVTTEDVQALVSRARETSIFDLVDCVGRRETDRALRLLHGLLDDGEAPLYLLTMLARQVRILIQVSELQASDLTPDAIAGRLKLHPFVVKKGLAQARNFRLDQLERAHERLIETDWAIKTGQLDEVLALGMLVVALTTV